MSNKSATPITDNLREKADGVTHFEEGATPFDGAWVHEPEIEAVFLSHEQLEIQLARLTGNQPEVIMPSKEAIEKFKQWMLEHGEFVEQQSTDHTLPARSELTQEQIDSETLAGLLYAHSTFHEDEPNPTAQLMKDAAARIRELEINLKQMSLDLVVSNFQMTLFRKAKEQLEQQLKDVVNVLREIQQWDCLNPPRRDLCADPWLKKLITLAINKGEPK